MGSVGMSVRRIVGVVLPLLFIGALVASAWSEDAKPSVKFSELEGMTILVHMVRAQTNRRNGRNITIRIESDWKVDIEADNTLRLRLTQTAHTPRGKRDDSPRGGQFTIGEPASVPSRGGGQAVWRYADNTLLFLRTFPKGAFRTSFEIARDGDAFTCKASQSFLRENGTGPIVVDLPAGRVSVVGHKELSATCKVSKTK
jgi:hypothetical protein